MDWKLEVVVVPVTDVDRAKEFYVDKLGFVLDADTWPTESMRVVQMTPPGSTCSVTIGPSIIDPDAPRGPGASLQLVVTTGECPQAVAGARGGRARDPGARSARRRQVPVLRRPGRQQLGGPGDPRPRRRLSPAPPSVIMQSSARKIA